MTPSYTIDEYQHTQVGTVVRSLHTVLAVILGGVAIRLLLAGPQAAAIGPSIAALILFLCAVFLDSMTVRVSLNEIVLSYGVGLFRKTILVADVRGAETVRCRRKGGPIRGGMLYKVQLSGRDAVELQLANGRRIQIGTDEPQELLAAIHSVTGSSPI